MKITQQDANILSLNEYIMVSDDIDRLDAQLTDDIIDQAVSFDIDEDPITLLSNVILYDVNGAAIIRIAVEDYDTAVAYMEEVFELEFVEQDERDPDAAASESRWGHNTAGVAGSVDSGNTSEY